MISLVSQSHVPTHKENHKTTRQGRWLSWWLLGCEDKSSIPSPDMSDTHEKTCHDRDTGRQMHKDP